VTGSGRQTPAPAAQAPAPPPPPLASGHRGPIQILLVMKAPEAAFCAAALHRYDPALSLARAGDIGEVRAALTRLAEPARLIGFSTSVLVPGDVLPRFAGGAFNFHPGPPEYPGNRPSAFACYHGATEFGVTLHRMLAKVDSGEILDCVRFPCSHLRTAGALAIEAYQRLARLFLQNAPVLADLGAEPCGIGEAWGTHKTTLAEFEAMRRVPGDIGTAEMERRIRAFGSVYTPLPDRV
jgi:methionyl-tRNA formyltransferase